MSAVQSLDVKSRGKRKGLSCWIAALVAILGLAVQGGGCSLPAPGIEAVAPAPLARPEAAIRARASEAYGRLPLHFEANRGQTDSQVKFLSRGSGYTLFLTPTETVLSLHQGSVDIRQVPEKARFRSLTPASRFSGGTALRMRLLGANPVPQVKGLEPLPGKSHYFIGNDPKKWRTEIPTYGRVKYEEVYAGIDLVFYGDQRQLEYDFVVAPGADPKAIRLAFRGAGEAQPRQGGQPGLADGQGQPSLACSSGLSGGRRRQTGGLRPLRAVGQGPGGL